jgi:hypothetical protein
MWGLITKGISEIFTSWIGLKKSKNEAEAAYHMQMVKGEQDWDNKAMEVSKFSWKDEFIVIIWFSPLIVAWFDEDKAQSWIDFITQLPAYWWFGAFGMIAASFGLRWYFKSQSFKVSK